MTDPTDDPMTNPATGPSNGPAIRKATTADLPALERALGRAFHDDPVWRYVIRHHDRFPERVAGLVGIITRIHLEDDDSVWMTADGQAAAVWAPPKRWSVPPQRFVRFTGRALRSVGLRSVPGLGVLARMEKRHPKDPPHWYLAVLGTDPDAQGQGLGSAVLQPVLERCDREVIHAYLESSKESNVPFYERHGFRVVERVELGRGCPPIFTMMREPQPV